MRLLTFLSLSMVFVSGCSLFSANVKENSNISQQQLPSHIAGTWKAVGQPWKILLDKDGTILSAIVALGEVEIKPNQVTKVEMIDGQFSTYQAGDCVCDYDRKTGVLTVSIVMEYLDIKVGEDGFEGSSIDIFTGPVSADGKKWQTKWENIFDYGDRLPMDPNDIGQPLTFVKVDI